ncbi:VCBS domain-containing protein [Mesorhizobium loti]|uniref:VCBS domain-containing protein n=1 Tax=Rhizobium loti TaxID=381 RepID=UPI0014958956|nr:VCBS domain-containing protein [Mesorhizobium loti]QKC69931.1 type I secretion C-terminal target domain-containing protein [Mesorhizobium loti]
MTNSNDLDTVSNSWDEHSEHNGLPSQAQIQVAEAATAQKAAPAAAEPVPVDVGNGTPVKPEPPAEAKAPAAAHEYVADTSNVVKLPANVSIDNIKVDGHNLVLEQADGSVIVIKDGALNVPTFIIGDVEVPRVALIAALEASHVDVAFGADGSMSAGPGGSTSSAGGDFSVPPGGIGDGFGLSALLPPTDLAFGQPDNRELFPSLLKPDSTPSIGGLTPELGGGDTIVYEKGLTSAPDTSEINTGTFTISSPDGVGSLTIAGQVISGAALANSASTSVSITTPLGNTLTITGYDASTGQVSYSYTLVHSEPHPGAGIDSIYDNMTVTVTDTDGDTSAPATLSVQIVDDVPVAHNANAGALTEDGATTTVGGNVTTDYNNTFGADGPAASGSVGWGTATATLNGNTVNLADYGTLAQNANGTWSFVLDNSKPATQALGSGDTINVSLGYTLTDHDSDADSKTITFEINGANDNATVTVTPSDDANADGAASVVYEHGLTSVADTSETDTGTFKVTATDGIKDVTIGTETHTLADWVGKTINTGEGTLTITGMTPAGGGTEATFAYSYTLNGAQTHPAGNGNNTLPDSVAVAVDGIGGTHGEGTISIVIVDDVPVAHNANAGALTEDGATTTVGGNVTTDYNNTFGADGPAASGSVGWGTATATLNGNTVNLADYGTLAQNANGTWSFVLDNSKPATQALGSGDTINVSLGYTLTDHDSDADSKTITFEINGANDNATVTVTPSDDANADGAASVVYEHGLTSVADTSETDTGTFKVTATDGIKDVTIGTETHTLADWVGKTINTGEGTLTITGMTPAGGGTEATFAYSYTLNGAQTHPAGNGNNTLPDSVAVAVDGIGGTHGEGTISIVIVDDVPVAHNANAGALTEDGATTTVGGNVTTDYNNTFGADGPAASGSVGWGTATATLNGNTVNLADYGTLAQNANGTWSFVLDNSKPATQALGSGDTINVSLGYTLTDHDSDADSKTITFEINGTNDTPTITGDTTGAVVEAGNADPGTVIAGTTSTDPGALTAGSPTVSGTLTAHDPDAGATATWSGDTAGTYGSFAVNPTTGVWTYTLDNSKPATNALAEGASVTETFTVTVTDDKGATSTQNVTVTITGANDSPVISYAAGNAAGGVTEDSTLTTSGQLASADPDTGHTATWSVSPNSPQGTGTAYGTFSVNSSGQWTYTLNNGSAAVQALAQGQSVTETYTVRVTDDKGAWDDQQVTVVINGTNDTPTITGDTTGAVVEAGNADPGTVIAGTTSTDPGALTAGSPTVSGTLTAHDPDAGATATWSGDTAGTYGSFAVNPTTGVWTYTLDNSKPATNALAEGASVTETFTVTVTDDKGATSTQNVTVTITGANDSPVISYAAGNAAGGVTEDSTLTTSGQLASADPDTGHTATWSVSPNSPQGTGTAYGTFSVNSSGQWTYTLNNGSAAVQALAQGQSVTETYTVRVTDDKGAWDDQQVTVVINGTNDTPTITGDTTGAVVEAGNADPGTVIAGTTSTDPGALTAGSPTVSGTLTAHDPDAGATATWSGDTAGTYGSFAVNPTTGVWTYTLDNSKPATNALAEGASVTETFTVTVTDDKGATSTQNVTVTITGANDSPVISYAAGNAAGGVTEDSTLTTSGQLASADPDTGHTATWSVSPNSPQGTGTAYGTFSVNSSGQWTYTLNNGSAAVQALAQGQSVTETYTVRVTDDKGAWDDQQVTVVINGTNDTPTITGDTTGAVVEAGNADPGTVIAGTTSTDPGALTAGSPTVSGTLTAHDPDAGATATWSGDTAGTYGSFAVNPTTGVWTYTLDNSKPATNALAEGASVTETFTVTVTDDKGATSTQNVTVTITGANDSPVISYAAGNAAGGVTEDSTLTTSGQLASADPDTGHTATWSVSPNSPQGTGTAYGTFSVNSSGQWTYTLNNGSAAVQALAQGQSVTETYTVRVTDDKGAWDDQQVTVVINGTNDTPTITGDTTGAVVEAGNADPGTVIAGTTSTDPGALTAGSPTVSGTLTAHDPDAGATATWSGDTAGTYGSFAVNPTTGVWTYTLDNSKPATNALAEGASVTETFTVTVTDDKGATSTQNVTVTITGANDSPVISYAAGNAAGGVTEDSTLTTSGQLASADPDTGHTATWSVSPNSPQGTGTAYGTFSVNSSGQWTYTLNNGSAAVQALAQGQSVTETYTVRVTDDKGAWDDQQVTVVINGTNDTPTITVDTGNPGGANDVVYEAGLPAGSKVGPTTIDVDGTFKVSDPDGLSDVASVTVKGTTILIANLGNNNVINGDHGTLTITSYNAATGVATYVYHLTSPTTDVPNVTETDVFGLTVTDKTGANASAAITIEIVDDVPTLGAVQNQQTNDDPSQTPAVGTLHFVAGADGVGSAMTITADTTGLTSAGHHLVTAQSGNVLTAYADNDGSGTFTTGDTAVFTLTVNPTAGTSGQYVFDLLAPLDGTVTPVSIGSGSSFGAGPTASIVVDVSKTNHEHIVMVTGWGASIDNKGDVSSPMSPSQEAAWLSGGNPVLKQDVNVNGSAAGWGLDNNNFDQGEFMRFDFGTPNSYANSYTDPAGTNPYVAPNGITMDNVSYATFTFGAVDPVTNKIEFVAHYVDGTSQAFTPATGATSVTIQSPTGLQIAWIDAYESSGSTKLNLTSVGTISTSVDHTIPFTLQLGDGDGDTTTTANFSVHVKDGLAPLAVAAPILLDLNHDGIHTTDLTHSTVSYDYNGDGVASKTAWVDQHDGILAIDLNGDGKVSNAPEFVFTQQAPGAKTDLAALEQLYDTNHDGKLTAADHDFAQFGVWQDANGNGVSDPGEFKSLAALGIVEIGLESNNQYSVSADGSVLTYGEATFTTADGQTGAVGDIGFGNFDGAGPAGTSTIAGTSGADTFKIDNLNIKDLISDYHSGEGDKIDLSALFDKAPVGNIADYVHYNNATGAVSVDTSGSGNTANFVDVAVLQNTPAAGTINILYDDTQHQQHTATI